MTVPPGTRADDVVRLAQELSSLDPDERRPAAQRALDWSQSGALVPVQREPIGQLCVWAWIVEHADDVAESLLWTIGTLGWHIPPSQVAGVARALTGTSIADAGQDFLEDLDDYLLRDPDAAPHLLDPDAARRAVDLVRGLTSTLPDERLRATTMSAEVVASTSLTDEEARSFAGIVTYAVVVETDPTVRLEQARVLGLAARHERLGEAYRDIALTADLTDDEVTAISRRDQERW